MSKTLIVSFLPREGSNTAKLLEVYKEQINSEVEVIERNLNDASIPLLSESAMKTWWGPTTDNEVEKASKELIDELKEADTIIIATPMYNWSLPGPMKAWFDLVIRGGQTFEYGPDGPKGLLKATKAILFVTSGMTEIESSADHLTPVVRTGLHMMGVDDVSVVSASELLLVDKEEATKRMTQAAAKVA